MMKYIIIKQCMDYNYLRDYGENHHYITFFGTHLKDCKWVFSFHITIVGIIPADLMLALAFRLI